MKPLCIDISHHNAPVKSFHQAHDDGVRLVIAKATQGTGMTDKEFVGYRNRCSVVNLLFGAYHFGDSSPVLKQVDHFLDVAAGVKLLVLDWETDPAGHTMTLGQAELFVTTVHARTGRWPMIYGGSLLKALNIQKSSPLCNCELWLSQYGPKAVLPRRWKKWRLWQYTDGQVGPVPRTTMGVGNCDCSMFPGSEDDLARWYAGL